MSIRSTMQANLHIVLNTPKHSYFTQATPKNTCKNVLTQKIPQQKISNPKNPLYIRIILISEYPPPPLGSDISHRCYGYRRTLLYYKQSPTHTSVVYYLMWSYLPFPEAVFSLCCMHTSVLAAPVKPESQN